MRRSILFLLLFASFARAEKPYANVIGPKTARPGEIVILDASLSKSERPLKWSFEGPKVPLFVFTPENEEERRVEKSACLFKTESVGEYKFIVKAFGIPEGAKEIDIDAYVYTLTVIGDVPDPIDPTPKPIDPTPKPIDPTPKPIPTVLTNFRLLLIFNPLEPVTSQQQNIFHAVSIRDYLDIRTSGPNNDRGWRFWPLGVDLTHEHADWKTMYVKAVTEEPTKLPKLAIFDGINLVKIISLPENVDKTLDILKEYGGR